MKGLGLVEHGFPLQYAGFGRWPGVERVRQRDKSKAVGTSKTKLAMCLQERWGSSCGLPGTAVTWVWGSVQRRKAQQKQAGGKSQKQGLWLSLDISQGRVGMVTLG